MLTVIFFPQENLTSLLTDDEMQQLIENFDRLDVNQGNTVEERVFGPSGVLFRE